MNKRTKLTWDTLQDGITQAKEWEACEEDIKKLKQITTLEDFLAHKRTPYWLCWYAVKLKKGRIEAFEKIIATSAFDAYRYCLDVAEGRIPEMEKSIATDALYRFWYCRFVAKCRIPEMEEAIKEHGFYWKQYLELPEQEAIFQQWKRLLKKIRTIGSTI